MSRREYFFPLCASALLCSFAFLVPSQMLLARATSHIGRTSPLSITIEVVEADRQDFELVGALGCGNLGDIANLFAQ
jgi:hypothetical protein